MPAQNQIIALQNAHQALENLRIKVGNKPGFDMQMLTSVRLLPYAKLVSQLPPPVKKPTLFIVKGSFTTILQIQPGDTQCYVKNAHTKGTTYNPPNCLDLLTRHSRMEPVITIEGDALVLNSLSSLLTHPDEDVHLALESLTLLADLNTPRPATPFDPFQL